MATIATLRIGVEATIKDLEAKLKTARKRISDFGKFATSAQGLLIGIGGAIAARGLVDAVGSIAAAGSDLNETLSKTSVVFGPAADAVIGKADELANEFGVIRAEYLNGAAAVGLLGQASGLAQSESAALANTMAQLALDTSSFQNLSFEESLQKIRAGLAGEAEPLRALGVLLSDNAMKAEAARLGLAELGQELTEGQKVQARASLIMKGLATANGDLARTAESPANRMRELTGRIENLKADLGTGITAISQSVLGGLAMAFEDVAGRVTANREAISAWATSAVQDGGIIHRTIDGIGRGIGLVADGAQWIGIGFQGIQLAVTAAGGVLLRTLSDMGQGIAAVINLIPGMNVEFGTTLDAMADGLETLRDQQLADFKDAMAAPPPSQAINAFFDKIQAGAAQTAVDAAAAAAETAKQPAAAAAVTAAETAAAATGATAGTKAGTKAKGETPTNAAALLLGSTEARSAVLAALSGRGRDGIAGVEANTRNQLTEAKKQTSLLKAIAASPVAAYAL